VTGGKFKTRLITGIFVAVFFGIALYIRIALPYNQVFVGDWIKFTGTDAYWDMRIVDNLVHNFPHLNTIDPYLLYPTTMNIEMYRFFDFFLAAIAWLVGLGSPTQHTVDIVGVYLPAILGALTVIPVFFIGKALVNRWVGVISAGLIAISPGEFLGRSILGNAQHHVFEVLCTTTAMLFIILGIQLARQRQLTFFQFKLWNWPAIARPLIYSLVAGILLGLYLNAWLGALLFILIFFVYIVIQFIIDYVRGQDSGYLCLIGVFTFFITLIVTLLFSQSNLQIAVFLFALITTVVLGAISMLMRGWGIKAKYYPLILVGIGLVELAIFYIVAPGLVKYMWEYANIIHPTGTRLTILEGMPILFPEGEFTLAIVWANFTTGIVLGLIALGIFIYFIVKQGEADKTIFVVWSLIILIATLLMRRFAYYFAINIAILTGYTSWLILRYTGFRERMAKVVETPDKIQKKSKHKKAQRISSSREPNKLLMGIGVIAVFFISFYPNIGPLPEIGPYPAGSRPAIDTASDVSFAPTDAWCESLTWLRDNSPEPFGDPDFYYALYQSPFHYPETAYGVASLWDYGYSIARIARRPPICNPGLFAEREPVSKFFLAQDEDAAIKSDKAAVSKYIIVDYATVMPILKFYTFLAHAGVKEGELYDVYVQRQEGKLYPVLLYYPEYYRSFIVRLFNFDASQVTFQDSTVISYEDRVTSDGKSYKEIINYKSFHSYNEALAYMNSLKTGKHRIVGTDPFVSPIPLDSLKHYKLVYSSTNSDTHPQLGRIPQVKIFEYFPSTEGTVNPAK
jgi:oligosaccharyl transferase (archaeosortase A-associated)